MKIWFHRSKATVPVHDVRVLEYDLGVVRSWLKGMLARKDAEPREDPALESILMIEFEAMLRGYLTAAAEAPDDSIALAIAAGRSQEIAEGNPPMQIEFRGNDDAQH